MSSVIVVMGEALTDCVIPSDGGEVSEVPGGSPMNVAIGLGRLGHDVLLAARFAKDARGVAIQDHVQASHVKLIEDADGLEKTSTASAVLAQDGSASYEFDLVWDLTTDMIPPGDYLHVHTGSIGATLKPGAGAVVEILRRERQRGASISYDPNARPHIMGFPDDVRDHMESIIALSDIVKASDEDIDWLYPGLPVDVVVEKWRGRGAGLVLITKGADGVDAFASGAKLSLPTRATSVVDTIGAGDSFMAGLLSALAKKNLLGQANHDALLAVSEDDLRDVVSFALSCAAITVQRAGANPPTAAEMQLK